MSREHFYSDEEKIRARLLVLQELVGEQSIQQRPCPLLARQLTELGVLCSRLQDEIQRLTDCVATALKD